MVPRGLSNVHNGTSASPVREMKSTRTAPLLIAGRLLSTIT